MSTALYSTEQIRRIERDYAKAHKTRSLMQLAGTSIAKTALAVLKRRAIKGRRILVLAGPGNNGGDAWVAAAALRAAKCEVTVLSLAASEQSDPAAKRAQQSYLKAEGMQVSSWAKARAVAADCDLIIDGLFGTGLSRAPSGAHADVIHGVNSLRMQRPDCPVLAIDVPSGLNADTGAAYEPCINATHTHTLVANKPGLHTGEGLAYSGELSLDDLSVDMAESGNHLLDGHVLAGLLPDRPINAHKGSFGRVGIIGGAEGMVGAAILAARAALHMGPGKVSLGLLTTEKVPFDPLHPEIMMQDAKLLARDEGVNAYAIGMGMGDGGIAATSLHAVLNSGKPVVLDADALTLLISNPTISAVFQTKSGLTGEGAMQLVLTPHPGEAARLLQCEVGDVQRDRIAAARKLAAQWRAVVVLKGAGTVVAEPGVDGQGRFDINTSGNPGMASGGMGDALAGMIAAFLAQGMSLGDAARLAVFVHGAAADAAVDHGMAPRGLTASEVIFEARALLNSGLEHHEH